MIDKELQSCSFMISDSNFYKTQDGTKSGVISLVAFERKFRKISQI